MNPAEYYAQIVPQQYAAAMASASAEVLEQPEITATITITGEDGGTFGLRAMGREIAFIQGGIVDADLQATIGIEDWRAGIASGASEALIDYTYRRKIQVAKGLRGSVTLELERSDGSIFTTTTIFGRQEDPAVTIMMTSEDYDAMLRGELNGQMAFMMGRLKFDGSLPLLMAIGALAGM
jgi:putative sterol carrier protein